MSALHPTDEDGAPREPRFFARAAWLAAIPLAWGCSLAILLGVQGLSGAVQEARGPAHYHAHDGGHPHDHDHAAVERHHHGAAAQPTLVEDAGDDNQVAARTAKAGFDVLPFAFLPALVPGAARAACPSPLIAPFPEPLSACERPPASTRA